jgi:hypothetical protein
MANTLTNLIPTLYQAVDIVSRELCGMIPAVTINADAEQAAKDQTITYPIAPASAAADITPGTTAPDTGDQTFGNDSITISKARAVPVRWTGEEIVSMGTAHQVMLRDQIAQAMRTLTNEVEADLAALYNKTSRAYGSAATTPFGTAGDFTDAALVRQILVDNGAPGSDLQLVLNTSAGANLRGKQSQAQMVGGDSLLKQGVLFDIHGMQIRESAQIKAHTKGTGASGTISNAGHVLGSTTLNLTAVGTGTIVAGDVLVFNGDTNKYVVTTGDADISNGGTVVLGKPGILIAMSAATKAITWTANYAANMAFSRSAIHLVARTPAMPPGGDMADDVVLITDPVSGLTFQVALYREYRRIKYEIGLAWGVKAVKPEHMALLLG